MNIKSFNKDYSLRLIVLLSALLIIDMHLKYLYSRATLTLSTLNSNNFLILHATDSGFFPRYFSRESGYFIMIMLLCSLKKDQRKIKARRHLPSTYAIKAIEVRQSRG